MQSSLVLYLLSAVSTFLSVCQCHSQDKTPLYFLSMLPYPDTRPQYQPSWDEGPTLYIAEQMAVDHINQRSDVLANYSVVLVAGDSGCNLQTKAFLALVEHIVHSSENTIAGVVGPGCSTSAAAISMWRSGIDLVNIHVAGSLLLADRERYSNSFGTLDSTEVFVDASLALIAQNRWSQIAALYDQSRVYYYTTLQEFEHKIANPSNTMLQFSASVSDTFLPLEIIKQRFIRIIFLFLGPTYLSNVFCLAYHMDMYYPLYQWVIISRTVEEIRGTNFTYGGKNYSCVDNEVARASNGSIIIHYQLAVKNTSSLTDVGITYDKFLEQYVERILEFNKERAPEDYIDPSFWAASFYDAVWALALGFNDSLEELQQQNLSLHCYSRGNPDITKIIRQSVLNLKFHGMSGSIDFKESDGYTNRVVDFYQIDYNTSILVASYSNGTITHVHNSPAQYLESSFKGVSIPPVPVEFAVLVLLAVAVALVLTLALNVLVVVYAKFLTVKAASPNLLYIAFAGCYIIIFAEVSLTVSLATTKNKDFNCLPDYFWRSAVHIGLTLIVSVITTRTWRLYRIFVYYTNPGHMLSNKALMFIITPLVMVDILVLVIWVVVDPLKTSITSNIVRGSEPYIANLVLCTQHYPWAWFSCLMGYNYLLMFVALWITLKSRHIRNKAFRTRVMSLLVYMMSLVTGVGLPLYVVLSITEYHVTEFLALASVLAVVLYLTLFLLFLPPLLPVIRNKCSSFKQRV